MKLLVISDTHDSLDMINRLSPYIMMLAPNMIIHLGDYVSLFTLKRLTSFNIRFLGVFGNNDGDKMLMLKSLSGSDAIYDQPYEVDIDGFRTLLLHGFGNRDLTERLVNYIAVGGIYHLILYGHTHAPRLELVGNTLILNPGTLAGYLSEGPTLAFINTDELSASILDLNSGRTVKSCRLVAK